MIELLFLTLLLPLLLILPAFFLSRRKKEKESLLLPFVHIPAITLWVLLLTLGYGAQSLANFIEVIYLAMAAVVFPYLKVFIVDRFTARHILTTYGTVAVLAVGAFVLRALMPWLPE